MEKKKFALQLFGHMRTFDLCAPHLKKYLLNQGDFDIFIHTWSELERESHAHAESDSISSPFNDAVKKKINDIYRPKAIEIGEQVSYFSTEEEGKTEIPLNGLKNMHASLSKSIQLRLNYQKNHEVSYDFVVVMRPDIFLNEKFPLSYLENISKRPRLKNSIFLAGRTKPTLYYRQPKLLEHRIIGTDIVFGGRPYVIDKLSNIGVSNEIYFLENETSIGEPQFFSYLLGSGITISFFSYFSPKCWRILRNRNLKSEKFHNIRADFRCAKVALKSCIKRIFS